jgi:hypothetical protein
MAINDIVDIKEPKVDCSKQENCKIDSYHYFGIHTYTHNKH